MRTWDRQLHTNTDTIPTMYVRFVDDIFGTLDKEIDVRLQFRDQVNRNVKVGLKWDRQKIAFLGRVVKRKNGKRDMPIF